MTPILLDAVGMPAKDFDHFVAIIVIAIISFPLAIILLFKLLDGVSKKVQRRKNVHSFGTKQ